MRINRKVDAVQAAIGHQFSDTSLLFEALRAADTGPAFAVEGRIVESDGNKSLALLGDAILKQVVICDLHERGVSRGTKERALRFPSSLWRFAI